LPVLQRAADLDSQLEEGRRRVAELEREARARARSFRPVRRPDDARALQLSANRDSASDEAQDTVRKLREDVRAAQRCSCWRPGARLSLGCHAQLAHANEEAKAASDELASVKGARCPRSPAPLQRGRPQRLSVQSATTNWRTSWSRRAGCTAPCPRSA
jgi:hypothetical protein